MEIFYIVTISVAVILLIIILTYLGLKMASDSIAVGVYPPNKMRCPDNWKNVKEEDTGTYTCAIPDSGELNTGMLYGGEGGSILPESVTAAPGYIAEDTANDLPARFDFSDEGWSGFKAGLTADCSKRAWSVEHNVLWDGVTNYNSCD